MARARLLVIFLPGPHVQVLGDHRDGKLRRVFDLEQDNIHLIIILRHNVLLFEAAHLMTSDSHNVVICPLVESHLVLELVYILLLLKNGKKNTKWISSFSQKTF